MVASRGFWRPDFYHAVSTTHTFWRFEACRLRKLPGLQNVCAMEILLALREKEDVSGWIEREALILPAKDCCRVPVEPMLKAAPCFQA